jgi:hypothetical protein
MAALLVAPLLAACGTKTEGGACWGPTLQGADWDGKTGLLPDGGLDCAAACASAFRDFEVMPDAGCNALVDAGILEPMIACELVWYCTI